MNIMKKNNTLLSGTKSGRERSSLEILSDITI